MSDDFCIVRHSLTYEQKEGDPLRSYVPELRAAGAVPTRSPASGEETAAGRRMSVNRVDRPRSLEVAAVWLPGEGLHSQHGPIGDARLMATFGERTTPASENLAQGLAQFQSKSLEIVEGLLWRTEG